MKINRAFALVFCALTACPGSLMTPSPPAITDQGDCKGACANMNKLNCAEGMNTQMGTTCKVDAECLGPDGTHDKFQTCLANECIITCENFCVATEDSHVWLDPGCVAHITSCNQIESCPAQQINPKTVY